MEEIKQPQTTDPAQNLTADHRFHDAVDYSIKLQQIIEAIYHGYEIPHQELYHGKMAIKFREKQNAA